MNGPLEGLRVLDIGHVLAGPFAATMLADMGADVIKVEPPQGDNLRRLGPRKGPSNTSLWWKVAARGKRCITCDMRTAKGQDLVKRLVAQADVVVENFRPGTLEGWNLGWEQLHAVNPRLVMLRVSGYGQGNSHSAQPMFGRPSEALSGLAALTGFPDGPPVHAGFSLGDATTAMMGAFGVMCALRRRDVSGEGQFVDLALYETPFRLVEWQVPLYDQLGVVATRVGNQFPLGLMVGNVYRTGDERWLTMSAATENIIRALLGIVGGAELQADARFTTPEARQTPENHAALDALITAWIAGRPAQTTIEAFAAAGAVIAPVYDVRDICADAAYAERGAIVSVEDPELGPIRMPAAIPRLSATPGRVRWPGPALGQHNAEVYGELLGLDAAQLDALAAEKVV
jgi:crotonobetainyl-CoA:carnitine CoA-transferase CaiB-like acyl-CoA transferase